MSIRQKLMIAALASGAAIAVPSAAFASTASPAAPGLAAANAAALPAADTAPAKIHKVPCRNWTFNVYHDSRGKTCYEGPGTTRPDINNVHVITTGENAGFFCVRTGAARGCRAFLPHEKLFFTFPPRGHVELTFLQITRI
jgi:hypothetical protein